MFQKFLLPSFLSLIFTIHAGVSYGQEILSIKTDPRVEALSIFFTLATADTLDTKPTPSTYYRDVKAYFRKYNDDPSLNWYRKLKNWDGPDMASLGLFLSKRYPFKLIIKPEITYIRNAPLDTFLLKFNKFYKSCQVARFIKENQSVYERVNKNAVLYIENRGILNTVDSFYRSKQKGKYVIYTDILCNHGSNAIPSSNKIFNDNIMVKAGYIEDKSKMLTDDSLVNFEPALNVVAHESSHIYLKNFIKKYHARLYKIRNSFLTTTKGKRLADEQWENEVDELLVRVCVAKILAIKYGKESGEEEISNQAKHFILAKEMYLFMDKYTKDGNNYENIEDFYPELIYFLEAKANT
jgi:hypothetical protein